MCNRLTKLSVTMWYPFFGIFDDTSLWILPKTHDPSLCDTPDDMKYHTEAIFMEKVSLLVDIKKYIAYFQLKFPSGGGYKKKKKKYVDVPAGLLNFDFLYT